MTLYILIIQARKYKISKTHVRLGLLFVNDGSITEVIKLMGRQIPNAVLKNTIMGLVQNRLPGKILDR